MGMDALTNVAFESLKKRVFPKLQKHFDEMALIPASHRSANDDWQFMVYEARELLGMLLRWSGRRDLGLSDTEALALMMSMEHSEPQEKKVFPNIVIQHNAQMFEISKKHVNDCIRLETPDTISSQVVYHGKGISLVSPKQSLEIEGLNSMMKLSKENIDIKKHLYLDVASDTYALIVNHDSQLIAIAADTIQY